MTTKICKRCHNEKSLDNFRKHSGPWLRAECTECQDEYRRRYYDAHRDKILSQSRKNYADNPVKFIGRSLAWAKKNPDTAKIRKANRRALNRSASGNFTAREWRQLKADYCDLCAYCNQKRPLTADHVVPLIAGGSNNIDNIVPACKSCNSSKQDTPLLMWMYQRLAR
jgi:5-methylcytosine-specific restriction endonuclease McrA